MLFQPSDCVTVLLLQAMSMFSSALASGQLGPLLSQFGLPGDAVDAANRGGDAQARTRRHVQTHAHTGHMTNTFCPQGLEILQFS